MVSHMGKTTVKPALRSIDCLSEYDAWQKAAPLDSRLDRIADQTDGIPRLRELDGLLLLDTIDEEGILVYRDTPAARRELTGAIVGAAAMRDDVMAEDAVEDEPDDGFYPDYEPDYEAGGGVSGGDQGKENNDPRC